MKRVLATAVLAGIATVALSTGAHAAGNANAKIMLHALSLTTKNQCTRPANLPADCTGYNVSNQPLYPPSLYTYLLVVNGSQAEGVAGVQCGIAFNGTPGAGVDVFGWTLCATLEFASTGWPQAGGGNLITWDSVTRCQTTQTNALVGVVAVAGYFYMGAYSNDVMRVTPRPVDGFAKVANCGSVEDIPYGGAPGEVATDGETFLGAVGFGPGSTGINPCGRERPVAVAPTTWSGVKNLLSN
jgi:hypothetical protein